MPPDDLVDGFGSLFEEVDLLNDLSRYQKGQVRLADEKALEELATASRAFTARATERHRAQQSGRKTDRDKAKLVSSRQMPFSGPEHQPRQESDALSSQRRNHPATGTFIASRLPGNSQDTTPGPSSSTSHEQASGVSSSPAAPKVSTNEMPATPTPAKKRNRFTKARGQRISNAESSAPKK